MSTIARDIAAAALRARSGATRWLEMRAPHASASVILFQAYFHDATGMPSLAPFAPLASASFLTTRASLPGQGLAGRVD